MERVSAITPLSFADFGSDLREDVYEKYFSTLMYNTRTNISFGDLSYLLQPVCCFLIVWVLTSCSRIMNIFWKTWSQMPSFWKILLVPQHLRISRFPAVKGRVKDSTTA